jgi:chromosome partitioning protein
MARIIAVLNQKGGVGKTTTTVNVGAYLAKQGKKVLLVDLDPQGNATSGLGFDKLGLERTTYSLLLEQESPNNVRHADREARLKTVLHGFSNQYDVVLIDCPPSLGLLTVNALAAATDVLIPVQTEYYAMEGLSQLIQTIQRVQQGLNQSLRILGVVMTMYDSRTSLSEQVRTEIVRVFGDLVFKTVIPRNVRLAEAPSHGLPVMEYDKWSKGSRAYKALTKEVLQRVTS